MIKQVSEDIWLKYRSTLPSTASIEVPPLPENLGYWGKIEARTDYALSDVMLDVLKNWLKSRNTFHVLYFSIEVAAGDPANLEISIDQLSHDCLKSISNLGEYVLTDMNFSWAVFISQTGDLHVSGPKELFESLNNTVSLQSENR